MESQPQILNSGIILKTFTHVYKALFQHKIKMFEKNPRKITAWVEDNKFNNPEYYLYIHLVLLHNVNFKRKNYIERKTKLIAAWVKNLSSTSPLVIYLFI